MERYLNPYTDFVVERSEYEESLKVLRDLTNVVDTAYENGREDGREEGRKEGREKRVEKRAEKQRNTLLFVSQKPCRFL